MTAFVNWLRGIRASNLVFMFVAPVLIYLIAISRSYGPALHAVLGIEGQPFTLLAMFLLFAALGSAGFYAGLSILRSMRPDQTDAVIRAHRKKAAIALAVQVVLAVALAFSAGTDAYIVSVVVNEFDPRTVDWIVVANKSFALEPAFQVALLIATHKYLLYFAGAAVAIFLWALAPMRAHATLVGRFVWLAITAANFSFAFYVVMVAHAGFAVGIMVTLRAAFFAYIGASILGLVWALLTRFSPSRRASIIFSILGTLLIILSVFQFARPHDYVALAGNLDGKIGIVAGTPQGLADTIRYGEFLDKVPAKPFKIRSLATVDQALGMIAKGRVTAALLPVDRVGDLPVLWRADFLAKTTQAIAIVSLSLGIMFLLLVGIGRLIGAHPMAVFSDFFVDTIRGIPMLVIILYVGLPLAGALKSASAGYIDLQMMTRGVIAIAIGYSAYMAEIFRAGIEAIPKGQIEAARTLGLRELQVARLIIIPQAVAIVLPALGNEFIAMLKDTSLVSILSVRDLTQRMREFQAQSFLAFEPFNSAALIYVLLTLIAASGIKALDNIVNRSRLQ